MMNEHCEDQIYFINLKRNMIRDIVKIFRAFIILTRVRFFTSGHSRISYTDDTTNIITTYGTWGNKTPKGVHENLEAFLSHRRPTRTKQREVLT